ncbi:hypothetical protein [Rhizobium sp. AG855]|uniref:hypothetical protein n=1 Tax=Rhizobium sp. AG855 TaxID=2183898 RepID=UPI000E70B7AA|nr:hypothetical protein [Rhizobium sp. AG855]RKE76997.1 hypothetical protein DFO46_4748 [Rhizobium sp. AG855]
MTAKSNDIQNGTLSPELLIEAHRLAHEYAFGWFSITAQQRMTFFNYALISLGGLAYAYGSCLAASWFLTAAWIGLFGVGISFLFFQFDKRNSHLTKLAEQYLSQGTESFLAPIVGPTIQLAHLADTQKIRGMLSFGRIARLAYYMYALIAFCSFVFALVVKFCPKSISLI